MKDTTLLFLIKRNPESHTITDILLAIKKRSLGEGKWNGVGGKLNEGETLIAGLLREAEEEVHVLVNSYYEVAQLALTYTEKPEWDQLIHVFFSESWEKEPSESEEMRPEWYKVENIPYNTMWPDDTFWLPKVIQGDLVKGSFTYGGNENILEQHVEVVSSL